MDGSWTRSDQSQVRPANVAIHHPAFIRKLPLVTVVLPTYQRATSTECAIRSVLRQTIPDLELIVVDDGSQDGAWPDLRHLADDRLSLIRLEVNLGPAAARNAGIRQARGRYVAFLDSDDLWLPTKLERQLAFMERHRGVFRLSSTGFRYVDPHTGAAEDRHAQPTSTQSHLLDGCRCAPGSTLMVEAGLFDEIGLQDERLRRLEDWDWLLRATTRSDLGGLEDILSEVVMRRTGGVLYEQVEQASAIIGSAHAILGRRLATTIEHELAAAAYLDGRYLLAARHLATALRLCPLSGVRLTRRAWSRVQGDLERRVGAAHGVRSSAAIGRSEVLAAPLWGERPPANAIRARH